MNHSDSMPEEMILVDDVWEFNDELLVSALHPYEAHPAVNTAFQNLVPVFSQE